MSFSKFNEGTRIPRFGQGFLDCGAYSVLTGKFERLPINDYAVFTNETVKHWRIIAAPDVIGSAKKTYVNLAEFVKLVSKEVREKTAITYHLGDRDLTALRKMLEFGWNNDIRWLAIGGIVTPGSKHQERLIGINEILRIVRKEVKLPFRVHLFGGYTPEYIRVFRPDSVDSSTYLQKARMLHLFKYENWKMVSIAAPRDSEKALLDFIMTHFAQLYQLFPDQLDKVELREELRKLPDGVKFWILNGLYMRLFEKQVRSTNPDFTYWMTVAALDDSARYGDYVGNILFTRMWRDATLVAYPFFHGRDKVWIQNKMEILT